MALNITTYVVDILKMLRNIKTTKQERRWCGSVKILKYTNNRNNIADHTTLYDVFIHKKITAT
jgi:hypothetical protein